MSKMSLLFCGLCTGGVLLLLCATSLVSGNCDTRYGPPNTVHCIQAVAGYTSPQWATCLTDTYIRTKSQGRHQCMDGAITFCYYQCMLEMHHKETGLVYSNCACNPNDPRLITPTPRVILDPQCYSPTGEDCDWYRNCLEKKIPCEGGKDGYAIEYADKFCRRFQEYQFRLSYTARRWMEATRKCLQVSLVPALRPFVSPSCSSVKQLAFDAHPGCYYQPGDGAPSFCDLECSDWWQVFWIIKSAFVSDPWDSILGMMQVGNKCSGWETGCFQQLFTQMIRISLTLPHGKIFRNKRSAQHTVEDRLAASVSNQSVVKEASRLTLGSRHRRQVPDQDQMGLTEEQVHYHKLAAETTNSIAGQLGWNNLGLVWFGWGRNVGSSDKLYVIVLLADKYHYVTQSTVQPRNISQVVQDAAEAFDKGKLTVTLDFERVQLLDLEGCRDADCTSPKHLAKAPLNLTPPISWSLLTMGLAVFSGLLLPAF